MKPKITAYHGSNANFEKFTFGKSDKTTYSRGSEGYFTSSREVAETYGKTKKYKLSFENPLVVDFCGNNFTNFHLTNDDNLKLSIWISVHGYHEIYSELLVKSTNNKKTLSLEDRIGLNHIIKFAKAMGYDSIIAKNIVDTASPVNNPIADDYVVFNENSIN